MVRCAMADRYTCPLCGRGTPRNLIGFLADPGHCACERPVRFGERIQFWLPEPRGECVAGANWLHAPVLGLAEWWRGRVREMFT